jgi:pyruvate/2-oxoglutarate dehydrogenase complex dihydrolipoamide acyltransferase (E2) component
LGFSIDKAVLSGWLVPDGALVKEGDPLYSLESDKSVEEIPAPASGVLKILMGPGHEYPVGTVLGEIG